MKLINEERCDFLRYLKIVCNDPELVLLKTLLTVEAKENNESLVIIQNEAPELLCEYVLFDMKTYTGDDMVVRRGVLQKLKNVAVHLSKVLPGARLKIAYGYRHPAVQAHYFNQMYGKIKKFLLLSRILELFDLKSVWLDFKICSIAHFFAADPRVAGHPTGGAVDLSIAVPKKNGTTGYDDLDMGGAVDDFSSSFSKQPTFSPYISEQQKNNRHLLRKLMMQEEFAPFNGEWWHFSYGDKEWAAFYKQPYAIYNAIVCIKDDVWW